MVSQLMSLLRATWASKHMLTGWEISAGHIVLRIALPGHRGMTFEGSGDEEEADWAQEQ